MRITALKTVVVNAEMRNWVFVKVETDDAGLYGWGKASLEWKTRSVVGAVEDFAPMVIGEDPTRRRGSTRSNKRSFIPARCAPATAQFSIGSEG